MFTIPTMCVYGLSICMYGRFACSSISTTQSTTQSTIHSNSNNDGESFDSATSGSNGVYVSSECEGVGEREKEKDYLRNGWMDWMDRLDWWIDWLVGIRMGREGWIFHKLGKKTFSNSIPYPIISQSSIPYPYPLISPSSLESSSSFFLICMCVVYVYVVECINFGLCVCVCVYVFFGSNRMWILHLKKLFSFSF